MPACDFLFVDNTNICLHRFQVIADYWSNMRFRREYLSLTHSFGGELLYPQPRNSASRNEKHRSMVRCKMRIDTLNRLGECHGQTERALAITRPNRVRPVLKISMLKGDINFQPLSIRPCS